MSELTPADVEHLIDRAGRERVFAKAREQGWGGHNPPLWVWAQICQEILTPPTSTET